MSSTLYAEFASVEGLERALDHARNADVEVIDAYTPFPVEGLGDRIGGGRDARRLRLLMLIGGLIAAALAYGLEFYSAVFDYPFDVGGLPENSWPTFVLFPFEFGILCAAITGLVTLFALTGMPSLHHPVFDVEGIDRASNDRFFLALACPAGRNQRSTLETKLMEFGALAIREAAT